MLPMTRVDRELTLVTEVGLDLSSEDEKTWGGGFNKQHAAAKDKGHYCAIVTE